MAVGGWQVRRGQARPKKWYNARRHETAPPPAEERTVMAKKKPAARPRKPQAKKVTAKKVTAKKAAPTKAPAKKAASKAVKKAVVRRPAKPAAKAAGPAWPREGSRAPDFAAVAHDGSTVTLAALKGRPVVLYFYPKDDTPGCTVEACGFRDAHAALGRHKAVVIGVSPDSRQSHEKFRGKFSLPFTLLADERHAVAEKYGAWREKSLYGKTYMGVARSTFVIDAAGRIAKAFTTVKPEVHAKEVLAAVAALR
jgi:peroxiredoxin Q/BCP